MTSVDSSGRKDAAKTGSRGLLAAFICLLMAASIFFAAHLVARIGADGMVVKTALLMGTIVEIDVPFSGDDGRRKAGEASGKAMDEMRRIELLFNVFDKESEVSKINRIGKGNPLKVDEEVFDLIDKAVVLSRMTGGAFDITVKPLVDLWADAGKSGRLPSDAEIVSAVERTGYAGILLDREASTVEFSEEGMSIDLGGIAKGYASDRAVKVLREFGVKDALVNCGGDMYCMGRRSASDLWRVGIRHPRDTKKLFMELRLQDRAIDTSGDYERFFMANGKRYSHIIDPRTGYPIGDGVVSASVIAADSVTADALATALCVLGRDGMKVIAHTAGMDAVMVFTDKGRLRCDMSEGFKDRYNAVEKGQ